MLLILIFKLFIYIWIREHREHALCCILKTKSHTEACWGLCCGWNTVTTGESTIHVRMGGETLRYTLPCVMLTLSIRLLKTSKGIANSSPEQKCMYSIDCKGLNWLHKILLLKPKPFFKNTYIWLDNSRSSETFHMTNSDDTRVGEYFWSPFRISHQYHWVSLD